MSRSKQSIILLLTDGHHVVPAIQQAHAELQPLGGVAHVDQGHLPVGVLADGRRPGHQEPADDEQEDGQQAQHAPAGHVGDPLGRAGQEHLQHPAGGREGWRGRVCRLRQQLKGNIYTKVVGLNTLSLRYSS